MSFINEVMNTNMSLEPRLLAYMNKKEYYDKNNIKINFLEKEFSITSDDIIKINEYKKNMSSNYDPEKHLDLVSSKSTKFLESQILHDDERFKRFRKKMERNKNAIKQRHNYSEWNDGNYRLLPDEYITREAINTRKHSNFNVNSRDYQVNNRYLINNNNNNKRQQTRKLNHQINSEQNNIIGNYNSYAKNNSNNNDYRIQQKIDNTNRCNIPSMKMNDKKYHNTSRYRPVPYMGNGNIRDINLESEMRYSNSTRFDTYNINTKSKSVGYPNPSEHYFDYISDDLQRPEHTVLPFPRGGINTRLENKTVKSRDIS